MSVGGEEMTDEQFSVVKERLDGIFRLLWQISENQIGQVVNQERQLAGMIPLIRRPEARDLFDAVQRDAERR